MTGTSQKFHQVYLLAAIVFIDAIGANIIVPLLPFYALHFGAAADRVTLLNATYAVMALLAAPTLGRIADRIGRKRVLTMTLAGSALCYVGFAFSTELWELFLFRAIGGVMAAQMSVAQAFLSEVTTKAERPKAMGILNASVGAGYILGPLFGAVFAGSADAPNFHSPFLAASAISGLALVGALVFLPVGARLAVASDAKRRPEGAVRVLWDVKLLHLFPIFFGLAYAMHLSLSILPLWMHARFNAGPREVGYIVAVSGAGTVLVQAFLVGPITQRFGVEVALRAGVALVLLGVALVPFLPTLGLVAVVTFGFAAALGIANSSGHAMVSMRSPPERTGQLLGLNQSVRAIGQVASPIIGGILFAQVGANAPYAVGVLVLGACILLSVALSRVRPPSPAHSLSE